MTILRVAAAAGLCFFLAACDGDGKSSGRAEAPPPVVTAVELARMDVPLHATFMGQTQGSHSAAIKPQVTGILQKRLFEEGSYVEKGAPLFDIDNAPYKAALEQAQGQLAQASSTLENARKEYERVRRLSQDNAVSRQQLDSAYAAFRGAQAQVETAKAACDEAGLRLGYCRVEAPVSGWTSREVTTVGSLVTPESTLTFINQSDPMDVQFSVPGVELFTMREMEAGGRAVSYGKGSAAELRLMEGVEYGRQGVVIFLDTQVDTATSAVRAKARFPNPDGTLLPGQFVIVRVGGAKLVGAVMLPQEALMQTERGPEVYVLEEGDKVSLAPVTLGPAFGSYFLVEKGLEAGQKVVVQGQNKATPGEKVEPTLMRQELKGDSLDTPDSSNPVTGRGVEAAPAPVSPVKEAPHE
ncbi:efflux RND transporter periplasmic adaptor subunit [Mailhella massiliensis]|uniref:Efflux RND transporter periplasmic adaptor subunit n=1 Tax=Mailhella massiliensis TaxID=1903261 RepID=A0A921ATZ0_9BACT|nr:efflux RND transporter periplasmic adaptor subunit [Mailhella massiliensis]HJD96041.1 efflux RND transporter periplasmic adaptor subunit [Mailhella massiliensis]